MEKNKEDGMTDLEIIKKNFNIITDSESAGYDYWYELEKEALDAAARMAAEIERLQDENEAKQKFSTSVLTENLILKDRLIKETNSVGVKCGDCENWEKCSSQENMKQNDSCTWGIRKRKEGAK